MQTMLSAENGKTLLQSIGYQLETHNIKMIRFEVADAYGIPKCRIAPTSEFENRVTEGQWYPGGCFACDPWGTRLPGDILPTSLRFGDVNTTPSLDTFSVIPWCKGTARIITTPMVDGRRATFVPRNLALQQLERLEQMGFSLLTGFEHEFVLYDKATRKPIVEDRVMAGMPRLLATEDFILQVMEDLPKMGLVVNSVEAEISPGMMEVSYKPAFGIRGADQAYTCKNAIKEIALKNGYLASFMTRPFKTNDTSTAHFNHSLWDLAQQVPLLLDEKEQMSEVAQHWIAGLVTHAPGIAALMAPTVNCIRALGGSEPILSVVPCNATWGTRNRSVAFSFKNGARKSTYVENRMSMGGSDPYMVLAATVAAGIDGITRKLSLAQEIIGPAFDKENVPPKTPDFPPNMTEAVRALLQDNVIRESLGDDFINWFVAAKQYEIKAIANAEDARQWEQKVFFNI